MRVAVDMHFLQDKAQGIKTFLSCLYKAVAKRDLMHEFVFIFDKEDHVSESWRQHGDVVTLKAKSRAARLTYGIAQAVERAGGVDVCHVNNVVPYGLSCKVLLSVHDVLYRTHPEFFSNGFRFSQQIAAVWSFRRADIIALGSKYTLNQVSRLYPNLLDNMRLLYNGVDVDSYLSLPRDIAKQFIRDKYGLDNFILSVGRIDPRKKQPC